LRNYGVFLTRETILKGKASSFEVNMLFKNGKFDSLDKRCRQTYKINFWRQCSWNHIAAPSLAPNV